MKAENHMENTVIIGSEKYHRQKLKLVSESIMKTENVTVSG